MKRYWRCDVESFVRVQNTRVEYTYVRGTGVYPSWLTRLVINIPNWNVDTRPTRENVDSIIILSTRSEGKWRLVLLSYYTEREKMEIGVPPLAG